MKKTIFCSLVLLTILINVFQAFGQTPTPVTAGSQITNRADLVYKDPRTGDTVNGQTNQVVAEVAPANVLTTTPDETTPVLVLPPLTPGATTYTVCNQGNNPYQITPTAVSAAAGLTVTGIYYDMDASGTVTAGDIQTDLNTVNSPNLQPGTCLQIVVTFETGVLPVGQTSSLQLTISSAPGALGNPVSDPGTRVWTNGKGPDLKLVKNVNQQTDIIAQKGATVNYSFSLTNNGDDAARNIVITDLIAAGHTFSAGSIQINSVSMTDAAADDNGEYTPSTVTFKIPSLAVGQTITFGFAAKIDAAVTGGSVIPNTAVFGADNLPSKGSSNTTTVIVDPKAIVFDGDRSPNPISGAVITVSPANLPTSGFPVNPSNANPFTTDTTGAFAFNLPCQSGTYTVTVAAPGYFTRTLQVATVATQTGGVCSHNLTITAADNMPLAQAGGFTLTNQPVTLNNIAGFIQNIPLFGKDALSIQKVADPKQAEVGDVVSYRVAVSNNSQVTTPKITLNDLLPLGFYYAQGSAFIETNGNKLLITPTVNGRSLTFTVGNLNPKQTVYINYRCRVGADAHIGANINTALALSPEGIRSNESRARVDILPGITSLKQFIVGKVYLDNNQNGRFDEGDQPVVKAQLITSNGRSSLTDNTGAYSIPVIGAGTQMVGLVRDSVPDGYLPKYHNAQDGEWSLLLRTPLAGGTVLTGDFPLVKFQHQKPDCGTCQPPWVTPTPTSTPNQALINDSGVEPKTDEEVKAEREARNFVPKAATELNSEAMKREGVEQMNGEVARFTLPEKSVLYSQVAQFGVETFGNNKVKLLVNGEEVQAQVGETYTDYKTSAKRENFYGINLKVGSNEVKALILDPFGNELGSKTLNLDVAGEPVRYEVEAEKQKINAGARDETYLIVRAFDANGLPAQGEVVIATNSGSLGDGRETSVRSEGLNPVMRSIESTNVPASQQQKVEVKNGVGQIRLTSDYKAGNADIRVYNGQSDARPGTVAVAQTKVQFEQPLERPVLIGYGQVNFGKANPQSLATGVDGENAYGKVSIFSRFNFKGGVFTGSYQSFQPLNRDETFNQLVVGRFSYRNPLFDDSYSVLGDSSDRFFLTPSNTKGFARYEKGLNYIQFGDFSPFAKKNSSNLLPDGQRAGNSFQQAVNGSNGFAPPLQGEGPRLAAYNRNLTGLSVNLENAKGDKFEAAGARPNTAYARDVISGGTLSVKSLSGSNILIGTETVSLETRDRRNPSLVLKRTQMVRDIDYDLDYQNGRITFRNFIPTFDSELNLNQIVVSYEYEGGAESNVYLARGVKTFNDGKLSVGGTFALTRQASLGNFIVAGADLFAKTPNNGTVFVEFAKSDGKTVGLGNFFNASALNSNSGMAVEVEVNQPLSKSVKVNGSVVAAQTGFSNPFGGTVQPGSIRALGDVEIKATEKDNIRLSGGYEHYDYNGYQNSRFTLGSNWKRQWMPELSTILGYDYRQLSDVGGQFGDRQSHLVTAGLQFRPNNKMSFSIVREQNLTSDVDPTYPNNTVIGADYKINSFTRAFVTSRFGGTITPLSGFSGVGFSAVNSRREFNAGLETKFGRDTSLSGAYRVEEGVNGVESFAVFGIGQRWKYSKNLAFDFGTEGAFNLAQGKNYYSVYGGTTYRPNENFVANARYEKRTRYGGGDFLTAGFTGKPANNWTLLGRFQYAQAKSDGQLESEYLRKGYYGQIGGAWRPVETDKYGMFFQYNFRDFNQLSRDTTGFNQIDRRHQFSTDAFYNPTARWSVFGKYAFRAVTNGANNQIPVSTLLNLYQGRTEYRFGSWVDLGIEARFLKEFKTGTGSYGYAPEVGIWIPQTGLRFGFGYNFSGLDRGLNLPNENRKGFYFTITSKADRLFDFMSGADKESGFDKEEKCPERRTFNGTPCRIRK